MQHTTPSPLSMRLAIAIISAAAVGYEILLINLLSIMQWHHFAYMVISMALLGFGASGTFLALARSWLLPRFAYAAIGQACLFGVAIVGCFALAKTLAFNPEQLLWDPTQPAKLLGIYVLLAIPFFLASNVIALTLMNFPGSIPRVYAADLIGAGVGSLAVILLLHALWPTTAMRLLGWAGFVAAGVAYWALRIRPRMLAFGFVILGLLLFVAPASWTHPTVSPYKSLGQLLNVSGTRVVDQLTSPLGQLTVVASPVIPLRHAPGLSLNASDEPPPQLGVFSNGDAMTVITRYTGDRDSIAYLDYTTSALPYHLATPHNVLILGAGGGSDVLQARYHAVEQIDAVELNPQITNLAQKQYGEFAGHLYDGPGIRVHTADARGFLVGSSRRFDLIQSALVGSFAAQPTGLTALNEDYLFTVEALGDAIGKLMPDGYLSLTMWVTLPPRNALKLFATAIDALSRDGIVDVSRRVAMIRGWQTSTLLVKNGPLTDENTEAIRRFAKARSFDVVYYPGMQSSEANRYNLLDRPYFHEGAVALLGSRRDQFVDQYKFSLTPASDDKPYFSHFFRWSTLPEIISLRGRGGESLLEVGYLTLVVTLLQALIVGVVLILVPLAFLKRDKTIVAPRQVLLYFLSLGLGFIILEIAIIQKSMLLLHHPIYAAAVVIGTLLVCAGLGSRFADQYAATTKAHGVVYIAVAVIIGFGLVHAFAIGSLFKLVIGMSFIFKVFLLIVLVAPLGFVLGMPFPLGLARLAAGSPQLVAWAWGINGCASVVSAVLATLLAIHFGFNIAIIVALVCYGVALVTFPRGRCAK